MCTISPRPNRRGRGHPVCAIYEKSPYFRTSSSLNMAVRGIDSLRSPCGQPAHCVHGLSNWLSPVVDPRSGLLIPPVCAIHEKKPVLSYELFFKYGGEGGLTRFARPAGSPLTAFTVCPTGCRQLSNPGRGFSSPRCVQYTKKSPYFRTSSSLNMAVRGDSNPRYVAVYTLSRRAPSATRTPHQIVVPVLLERALI